MGLGPTAAVASPASNGDAREADNVDPALERIVRMAAASTDSATAALVLRAGSDLQLAAVYPGAAFPSEHVLAVARECIDAARHRFVCEEDEEGGPLFVAGEPVVDLSGEVLGALCVLDRRSRSSMEALRQTLGDLAQIGLPLIREAGGIIESISPLERLFSFVVSTLDSINTGALTPREVMKRVIEQAVDLTPGFGAVVGLVHGDAVRIEAASERVESLRGDEVPMHRTHVGNCVTTGRMLLCRDVATDPTVDRATLEGIGVRSLATVPLDYRSNTVGILTVFGATVNAFRPTDIRILEQLAMLIAVAVERSRSQQALRDSEHRYQALVRQTAEAIYFADPASGEVLEANPAFFSLLEYQPEELGSINVRDFVDHDERNIQDLLSDVSPERLVTVDRRWRSRSGRRIDVQATISFITNEGRDLIVVIARDVTQQRLSEARQRRTERKYRDLFERANVPILIFRADDEVILEANQQALNDYGFTRDELLGRSLKSLTANVHRGEVEISHIIALGGTQNFETVHYRKDRTSFNMLVSCSLIEYDGSTAVLMFGRDISDRKRAERLLSESEARLRAVTENALDLIGILDERGRVRYMAGPIEEVLGVETKDVRATIWFDSVHPDDLDAVQDALSECFRHPERVVSVEFRYRRADGSLRDLSLKGRNLMDQPGVNGMLVSIRDVTERKQFEAELVMAKEKAEEMARLKSAFLANMSHEIRTPLTAILGFADVLAREVQGEHKEFVGLIQEGGRRLSETLNSVLDLARLEAGGFKPALEAVDVRESVRSVLGLFEPMVEKDRLSLEMRLSCEPAIVNVDPAGLNRILQNLISNAIKFTDRGVVSVETSVQDGNVVIDVADTGRGIDESFLPHLFDEFKQESTGLARSHEGTGLGLTITRRLVEMMGGLITVRSRKGEGSTFTLRFPSSAGGAPLPRLDVVSEPEATREDRPRVLLVEDNIYSRLLVDRLLRDVYHVTVAPTSDDALATATDATFDVVLLDINLGEGRDGVAVMHELRTMSRYEHVPMIALTAYAMPEDRARFLEAGFDGYLAKPFTKDELQRVIAESIAR